MSTVFIRCAILALLASACGRVAQQSAVLPAPPVDSREAGEPARQWTRIIVDGPYGKFEMFAPVITLSTAEHASGSLVLDSTALHEVERRLSARITHLARSQAAALLHNTARPRVPPRNPAPAIKPGLLGAIPFGGDLVTLSPQARDRIAAVARLARELGGDLEIVARAAATNVAAVDDALARARRVYLELLATEPRLAERPVHLSVRPLQLPIGVPRADHLVEVFTIRSQ